MRLAFAVIAHAQADILVIDEALSVGDFFFTQKCMRFLHNFQKTGTILFVSHSTDAVLNLCGRALWLDEGRLRVGGHTKEVCESYLASFQDEVRTKVRADSENTATNVAAAHSSNNMEIALFNPNATWFGCRGATIIDVRFESSGGQPLVSIEGGRDVVLSIRARADRDIIKPIIGFYFKDRLGQNLFGDNSFETYREADLTLHPGDEIEARFAFQIPILRAGDYSICAAIAEGTQEEHVQHHWIHDALVLKSIDKANHTGLVGVSMQLIEMNLRKQKKIENCA